LLQRVQKRRAAGLPFRIVRGQVHEHPDAPHALGLLRARDERPPDRRAAEKGDKFPPPHEAYPKAKDHDLIIAPCMAAKTGHSCPEWVLVV
jgi:hypothetical protein